MSPRRNDLTVTWVRLAPYRKSWKPYEPTELYESTELPVYPLLLPAKMLWKIT